MLLHRCFQIILFLTLSCNLYIIIRNAIKHKNNDKNYNEKSNINSPLKSSLISFTTGVEKSINTDTTTNKNSNNTTSTTTDSSTFKILHIITSLQEYDDGDRGTIKRNDRLYNILIPSIKNITESITLNNNNVWSIDVYLILGYRLNPKREQILKEIIPKGVGLEIWDNATPYFDTLHQERNRPKNKIRQFRHSLARQHRYVIKDKLDNYDFFSCWVRPCLFLFLSFLLI